MKTRPILSLLALLLLSEWAAAAGPPPVSVNRAEFLHAWRAYEQYAWGHDEFKPLSKAPHDWHAETLYMTPVDALDTLLLMG